MAVDILSYQQIGLSYAARLPVVKSVCVSVKAVFAGAVESGCTIPGSDHFSHAGINLSGLVMEITGVPSRSNRVDKEGVPEHL